MNYVVFDMEWNQTMGPKTLLPDGRSLECEIIEIGAVKLDGDLKVVGTFKRYVKPTFYTKLTKRVRELTGIEKGVLETEGVPFPEAARDFFRFCGEEFKTVTWGPCDLPALKDNLAYYRLPRPEIVNIDLQSVFDRLTGSKNNTALESAAEKLSVSVPDRLHDALNDALLTAEILKLDRIFEASKSFESTPRSITDLDHVFFERVKNIDDTANLKHHPRVKFTQCPECKRPMEARRLIPYTGTKKIALLSCPDHGDYLLLVHLSKQPVKGGKMLHSAAKYLYVADDSLTELYQKKLKEADKKKAAFLAKVRNKKNKK